MTAKLFNSTFEMELRILLLLLESNGRQYTVDRIVVLDFITCYSADFSLPYGNLHGENSYKFGEMSNRRLLAQEAVKELVTKGFITVAVDKGYYFSISDQGKAYAKKFKSAYAKEYKIIAKAVIKKYRKDSDEGILAEIQSHSIMSLKV